MNHSELDELLHISHAVGSNALVVQAGGGNTSVKCADGTMIIKASGTPLHAMTRDKGWVRIGMEKILMLFRRPDLVALPPAQREKEVLSVLYSSVIEPADARPSVETPLHALLNRTVIHTHPVAVTALACHPDGAELTKEIFRGGREQPLWFDYTDPGATLAVALSTVIENYKNRHGGVPGAIMQQNHGIFVSAATATDTIILHNQVLQKITAFFLDRMPEPIEAGPRRRIEDGLRLVLDSGARKLHLRFSKQPDMVAAARGPLAHVLRDALSPDHVVYTGPCALFLAPDSSAAQAVDATRKFIERWGVGPKLIVIEQTCVCIAGESETKVDATEALALTAIQAAALNGNRMHFLAPESTHFIMNWEAEHYRARQQ